MPTEFAPAPAAPPRPASADPASADPSTPIFLYDGACGLCKHTVRFLLRHDPHGRLRFAPQHSPLARQVLGRHGLDPATLDSAVLVRNFATPAETVATHSNSILACLTALGGPWRLFAALARLIPRPIRDAAYRLLARNRIRIFGAGDSCRLPTSAERARFLDT